VLFACPQLELERFAGPQLELSLSLSQNQKMFYVSSMIQVVQKEKCAKNALNVSAVYNDLESNLKTLYKL